MCVAFSFVYKLLLMVVRGWKVMAMGASAKALFSYLRSVCRCLGNPAGTHTCSSPECSDTHPRQHTHLGSHCTRPCLYGGGGVRRRRVKIESEGERRKREGQKIREGVISHTPTSSIIKTHILVY